MHYTSLHTLLLHLEDVLPRRNGLVGITVALVELVLELDPMQAQRMQEALHRIHAHQHAKCHPYEDVEHDGHLDRRESTKTIDW